MELIQEYGRATGARLNINKSKALGFASWNSSASLANIPYSQAVSMLGFRFASTTEESRLLIWFTVTGQVHSQRDIRQGFMHAAENMVCTHLSPFEIWYVVQICPAPN
jgi:hypothetical protein